MLWVNCSTFSTPLPLSGHPDNCEHIQNSMHESCVSDHRSLQGQPRLKRFCKDRERHHWWSSAFLFSSSASTLQGIARATLCGIMLTIALSPVVSAYNIRENDKKPRFQDTPNNVTATVGADATLPCVVNNLGTTSVFWRKTGVENPITVNEVTFDPDNSYRISRNSKWESNSYRETNFNNHQYINPENPIWSLKIMNVQYKHAGVYQCTVSWKHTLTRNFTLHVVESSSHNPVLPSLPLSPEDRDNRFQARKTGITLTGTNITEKGSRIELNCTVTAVDFRPKSVDWFKDGSRIKSDSRTLINYVTGEYSLKSKLEIYPAMMADMGTYVCRLSKEHVKSLKVMVLNTDSNNNKRDPQKASKTVAGDGSVRGHRTYSYEHSSQRGGAGSFATPTAFIFSLLSVMLTYALT